MFADVVSRSSGSAKVIVALNTQWVPLGECALKRFYLLGRGQLETRQRCTMPLN